MATKALSMSLACWIVLAPGGMSAQNSAAAKERTAADGVARFVERVRSDDGLPYLRRIEDGHLRQDACRRATKGDKSGGHSTGIGPPEKVGMLAVFWYSTRDPNERSPDLAEWIKGPGPQYEQPHRFAVGVCVVSATGPSEERYWVEIGTYMSAIKSLFYRPVWD